MPRLVKGDEIKESEDRERSRVINKEPQHKETVAVDARTMGNSEDDAFEWTTTAIIQSLVLFVLAGVAEIVGGWMVWMALRGATVTTTDVTAGQGETTVKERKPWWYAVLGSLILVVYGFIPCLQPMDSFGRIYAAYGGFFIVLSFLFGWALDGDRPDLGDVVGGSIALLGVLVVMFWPR